VGVLDKGVEPERARLECTTACSADERRADVGTT